MPKTNDAIAEPDASRSRFSSSMHSLRVVPSGMAVAQPATLPTRSRERIALPPRRDHSSGRTARLLEVDTWSRVRAAVDFVALVLATGLAVITTQRLENRLVDVLGAFCFPLLVMAAMHRRRLAERTLSASLADSAGNAVTAIVISAVVGLALSTLAGVHHSVQISLRLGACAAAFVVAARAVLYAVRALALQSEALRCPTVIVGSGELGLRLARRLDESSRYGLRPVALLLSGAERTASIHCDRTAIPTLGGPQALSHVLDETDARHVVSALTSEADDAAAASIDECQRRGVAVSIVPHLYEHFPSAAMPDDIGGVPIIPVRPVNPSSWGFAIKHAIDRTFAAIMLVILAPTLAAIAAAVRLSSPGPVMFRQRRVGRDGAQFDVLKFRTMRVAAEVDDCFAPLDGSAPGGVEGVDRRTKLGRLLRITSLDELPQLFNVLRGDMSLVGPRPERPEYVARFSAEIDRYDQRHRVKSGITGLAQANGLRGKTSMHDRVELDNFYIRNWSLWLDLRICLMTVREVFRMRAE